MGFRSGELGSHFGFWMKSETTDLHLSYVLCLQAGYVTDDTYLIQAVHQRIYNHWQKFCYDWSVLSILAQSTWYYGERLQNDCTSNSMRFFLDHCVIENLLIGPKKWEYPGFCLVITIHCLKALWNKTEKLYKVMNKSINVSVMMQAYKLEVHDDFYDYVALLIV